MALGKGRADAVWPDVGLKTSPNSHHTFGLFLQETMSTRAVKIAQSGHTELM